MHQRQLKDVVDGYGSIRNILPQKTSRNEERHNSGWLWDSRINPQALWRLVNEMSEKEGWPLEKALHVNLVSPPTSRQFQKSAVYLLAQRSSNIISCEGWSYHVNITYQRLLSVIAVEEKTHFIVSSQTLFSPHKYLSWFCGNVRFQIGAIHTELESFVFLWIWFKFFSCDNGLNYHNQWYLFGEIKKEKQTN